jgi:hypothetical protein
MKRLWMILLLAACTEKPPAPAAPLQKPAPLEPLIAERVAVDAGADGDATYSVKPFTFSGEPPPTDALRVDVAGQTLKLAGAAITLEALKAKVPSKTVVVAFDPETYLAQTLPLLALLDDAGAQVWLQSPDVGALAWPVKLRDEASFNAWLDEGVPGKLRIVHRADGFELQTNMGKLAGGDPKGPTVPTRGGQFDLVTLQKGLDRVKRRFTGAPDVCFMPSYAMAMNDATRAVATNWLSKDQVVYADVCLVYPRPATDAGR